MDSRDHAVAGGMQDCWGCSRLVATKELEDQRLGPENYCSLGFAGYLIGIPQDKQ